MFFLLVKLLLFFKCHKNSFVRYPCLRHAHSLLTAEENDTSKRTVKKKCLISLLTLRKLHHDMRLPHWLFIPLLLSMTHSHKKKHRKKRVLIFLLLISFLPSRFFRETQAKFSVCLYLLKKQVRCDGI